MNDVADINWLYNTYYKDNPELYRIVITHSRMVARKALEIVIKKNLPLEHKEVFCAALLHDIGVVECDAPDIHAYGSLPYIQHGLAGKKILDRHGLFTFSNICVRHTGAGITSKEITEHNLPLPKMDFVPRSLLEKLICYADKFYSKSGDLKKEKDLSYIRHQMQKFGDGALDRFNEMHSFFATDE